MDLQFPEIPVRYGVDLKAVNKGSEWDTAYESKAAQWCQAAYEEAELDRKGNEELKQLGTFIDYIEGKMWRGPRASYKSKPVNPKVWDNFWELVGLLTDIKPIMDVKSGNPDQQYQESARVLNKGIRAWAFKNRFDMRMALAVAWGVLTTGFMKWQWNPDLAHGKGDLQAKVLGPKEVLLLKPEAEDPVQSCLCLITERPVALSWLRRKFPTRGQLVVPDMAYSSFTSPSQAPPQINSLVWEVMSDGLKRKLGRPAESRNSAFPMAVYQELWFDDFSMNASNVPVTMGKSYPYIVKPFGRLYPRGRVIVRAGNRMSFKIMDDQPSPYFHGKKPFTMLRLNAVPWSSYGLSDCKNWIGLNDILNQILAGIIDMIKRAVNPGFFAPRNAFTETVWSSLDFSKPGERAAYSPNVTHEPKFAPAPVLPGYVMQTYQVIERSLESMSGKAAANQMMGKKQIPGEGGIEAINMMRTTPIRRKASNIEGFLEDGGNLMVPNMIQFYTDKRRMSLMGSAGSTAADFDWDPGTMIPAGTPPEEFIQSFNYHVKPGSLLQVEKRGKIADAMTLRRQGDLDRGTLFQVIDEEGLDKEQVEKALKKEVQEKIAMMPPKGGKGKK